MGPAEMAHDVEALLKLDALQLEQHLQMLDSTREAIGQHAHQLARLLFAASQQARIDAVGEKTARCYCWWEHAMDSWDDAPEGEKPLWVRLSDRGVAYDELASSLGAGHVPSTGFLCDAQSCDCPHYDEQGQPRTAAETARRLNGPLAWKARTEEA